MGGWVCVWVGGWVGVCGWGGWVGGGGNAEVSTTDLWLALQVTT